MTAPIPMILHCRACGMQHIDAPEEPKLTQGGRLDEVVEHWTNPPHRSHKCASCGYIWRPADVATTGVASIETVGKADHPLVPALIAPLQPRVRDWALACFGAEITNDKVERRQRFLEEALELVQAAGGSRTEVIRLMEYVFSRPVGELPQEVGGTMTTLAAFCAAHNLDMHDCGEHELFRIWGKIKAIREKQATKPKDSPLPQVNERVPEMFDVEAWHGELGSTIRSYGDAIREDDADRESGELLALADELLRRGRDAIDQLQMQVAVAGTETAAYNAGENAAFAGITERWEQALKDPIPKAGVMSEPLEGLYRQTEELRRKRNAFLAFVTKCAGMSGYQVNGNRLAITAQSLLNELGEVE